MNCCLVTAPDAAVVSSSFVGVPNVSSILDVAARDGLANSARMVLVPTNPVIESPGNVATPATAFLETVPLNVVFWLVTDKLICPEEEETMLLSMSLIRTTTLVDKLVALAALAGATSSRFVAVPGLRVRDCVALVSPVEVKVRV